MLYEVHGDGVPGLLQDQKLFKASVGSMTRSLSSVAIRAGLTEVLDESSESGPSVISSDEGDSPVLTEVSSG